MKLRNWNIYELIWLSLFTLIAVFISLWTKDSVLGFVTFLSGVFCVVLTAKGSIYLFLWGYINILSYAWITWQNGLYGELMLNMGFFLPMNFIGQYKWKHNIVNNGTLKMRRLSITYVMFGLCLCICAVALLGFCLGKIEGQNTPYLDALTNVFSIVAVLLLTYRYREQWLCWIFLDIFTIVMWALRWYNGSEHGPIMVLMWSAYLVNAFYGWYNWSKHSVK